MSTTFTRQELFDLVWSEPMKRLASRFKLSDAGLAKACRKANIPRPPRGYWARLAAGKKVGRPRLPDRGPGMSNEIEVGGDRYRFYRQPSDNEILNSNPQPPVFEDDIEDVEKRVRVLVPRVTVPLFPERAHRQIRRLLDADEERRQKQLASRYPSIWDAPVFNNPFEKRRLRLLNAIVTALEKAGMRPFVECKKAHDLSVRIYDTVVQFALNATTQKNHPVRDAKIHSRGRSDRLRMQILTSGASSNVRASWEDADKTKLETHLTDIVVALIVAGERRYRERQQQHYERLVERKASLLDAIEKRKEEAERKEREQLAALEKERINRLLRDASAFRQAADIRNYVFDVEARFAAGEVPVSRKDLDVWRRWALAQADRIDPVRSTRFLDSMQDDDRSSEGGRSSATPTAMTCSQL